MTSIGIAQTEGLVISELKYLVSKNTKYAGKDSLSSTKRDSNSANPFNPCGFNLREECSTFCWLVSHGTQPPKTGPLLSHTWDMLTEPPGIEKLDSITFLPTSIVPPQNYQWLRGNKNETGALLTSPTMCCSQRTQTHTDSSQPYWQRHSCPFPGHRPQVSHVNCGTAHCTWWGHWGEGLHHCQNQCCPRHY